MGKLMSLQFRSDSVFEPVLNNGHSRMTLVSLSAGEAIEAHRAPVPVTVVVLTGEIKFSVETEEYRLKAGQALVLEPHEAHALAGIEQSTVLVTRLANLPKIPPSSTHGSQAKSELADVSEDTHSSLPARADMMANIAPELKTLVEDHSKLWELLEAVHSKFDLDIYTETLQRIGEELDHHFVFEETILFPRVATLLGGADVGPIAMLLNEHKKIRKMHEPCVQLLKLATSDTKAQDKLSVQIRDLIEILWQHIEKEDKFIFPMASRILSKEDLQAIESELTVATKA